MQEQSRRHRYMVSKAPTVFKQMQKSRQFSVCRLCLLCHLAATPIVHCYITPHECLQAVARADRMKGNLLFTRKSPTCAIRPKASHDRQFFFLLVVNHFFFFFLLSSLSSNLALNTSICLLILCRRPEQSIKQIWAKRSSSQEQCSVCAEAGLPSLFNPLFQTRHKTHFILTLLQFRGSPGAGVISCTHKLPRFFHLERTGVIGPQ